MKNFEGSQLYQVKDLIEDLKMYNPESLVKVIFHDEKRNFHEMPMYKTAQTADETEYLIYLSERHDNKKII